MIRFTAAITALLTVAAGPAFADGHVEAGKKVFNKCKACHMVGADAKSRVGPPLNGVVGRAFGTVEGYRYSEGKDGTLLAMAEDGHVWDVETLSAYLAKPKDVIPAGKMAFAGLRDEEDIENVIAYLASFAADGTETDPEPVIEAAGGS